MFESLNGRIPEERSLGLVLFEALGIVVLLAALFLAAWLINSGTPPAVILFG